METQKDDYTLTMFEACEKLGKSKKTLSRYVRKRLIRPKLVKSLKGTPEYRFSESELQAFKEGQPRQEIPFEQSMGSQEGQNDNHFESIGEIAETRQETKPRTATQDKKPFDDNSQEIKEKIVETRQESKAETGKLDQIRQESPDGFVALLQRTVEALSQQLKVKDDQIEAKDKHIDKLTDRIGGLIERNKELNYIVRGFQDKLPELEAPKSRRGRKAKPPTAESVGMEEAEPEERQEAQEPKEAPEPPKEQEEAPAGRQQAPEEPEAPKEEAPKPEEKSEKRGFWKKLFTKQYNLS